MATPQAAPRAKPEGKWIDAIEDYVSQGVPPAEKQSAYVMAGTWLGFAIYPAALVTGGVLGGGLPFWSAVAAILVGTGILVVLQYLLGSVAVREGLSTHLLNRLVWGTQGGVIPSLFESLALWGWFGVILGFNAEMFKLLLGGGEPWLWSIILGIVFTASAIFGVKGIAFVAKWGSPLLVIISIWAVVGAVGGVGGWGAVLSKAPVNPISFAQAVGITAAFWMVGTSISPDLYRYARDAKGVLAGAFSGMVVGTGFCLIMGVILALALGQPDIVIALQKLGLISTAMLLLLVGNLTSLQINLYTSSLGLATVLNVRRSWTVLLGGLGGIILAALGVYTRYINWLLFIGFVFPGFVGVQIAEYWLLRRSPSLAKTGAWRPVALIAWAVSALVEYYFEQQKIGMLSMNGLITAMVVYVVLSRLMEPRDAGSRQ